MCSGADEGGGRGRSGVRGIDAKRSLQQATVVVARRVWGNGGAAATAQRTHATAASSCHEHPQRTPPPAPSLLLPRRPHARVARQRGSPAAPPRLSSGQQRGEGSSDGLHFATPRAHLHTKRTHCTTCSAITTPAHHSSARTESMGRLPPRFRTSVRAPASSSARAQSTWP